MKSPAVINRRYIFIFLFELLQPQLPAGRINVMPFLPPDRRDDIAAADDGREENTNRRVG